MKKIKIGEEFQLHDTVFTYSVVDGNISLKRVNKAVVAKSKSFVAPTIEEVKEFFKSKGYTAESAEKAFNYYDVADWKDSRGKSVLNWKQKLTANWMRDEHKIKTNSADVPQIKFFQ